MAGNSISPRGVEAVGSDTVEARIAHKEIAPRIRIPTVKDFNHKFGAGNYKTTLPGLGQILHPIYLEYDEFELIDDEDMAGRPDNYPTAVSLSGIVGNLILKQLRSGVVVRDLYLNNVQALNENGAPITPADFLPFYETDTPPAEISHALFRRIHVPLKGTVILNLVKIPKPRPRQ
jgi:hypothetical protein